MTESLNFLEEIIDNDLKAGTHGGRLLTRFPPEPNGYLHVGHATSICLNFGLGLRFGGATNLRFDDTNPVTEDTEYVDSIIEDVRWLGFEPATIVYASDYFEQLFDWAMQLIKAGKAYVDFSSKEEIANMKGTPTEAGQPSPYRNTSIEENIDRFYRMRQGAFAEGVCTLRAKIDMTSSNMIMRDPLMYRIKYAHHHRTGDKWCIYPMYDWAHGQSDSIEQITHSICTLEFAPHRELYDWCIEQLGIYPSKQYEFARKNVSHTITSKRKLKQLVEENHVRSWDDPRMPTISGFRRRGYTPSSIREFCKRAGIAKRENIADLSLLEFCVREELNKNASRIMAVLNPLKVVISNFEEMHPEGILHCDIENNPEQEDAGTRKVPFSKSVFIEREDFMEEPIKGFHRLSPGNMVRLKGAYIIEHESTQKDAESNITSITCKIVANSRSGNDTSGVKVKSVSHWVSEAHAVEAECRIYDRLFNVESPDADKEVPFLTHINPDSLQILSNIYCEPAVSNLAVNECCQFLRHGYFCIDKDSKVDKLVFNRTVTLKDAFKK